MRTPTIVALLAVVCLATQAEAQLPDDLFFDFNLPGAYDADTGMGVSPALPGGILWTPKLRFGSNPANSCTDSDTYGGLAYLTLDECWIDLTGQADESYTIPESVYAFRIDVHSALYWGANSYGESSRQWCPIVVDTMEVLKEESISVDFAHLDIESHWERENVTATVEFLASAGATAPDYIGNYEFFPLWDANLDGGKYVPNMARRRPDLPSIFRAQVYR